MTVWDVLGLVNGKTLLVAIICGVVGIVLTIRPGKEEDE